MADVTALRAILVRARKVITDDCSWTDCEDAVELVEDIDNELGEVPEAGKGAYDNGRV